MNVSPAKENMLKKIRKALTQSTPLPFPHSEGSQSVFQAFNQELEVEFAEQFSKLLGKVCLLRRSARTYQAIQPASQSCRSGKMYFCQEEKLEDHCSDQSEHIIPTSPVAMLQSPDVNALLPEPVQLY